MAVTLVSSYLLKHGKSCLEHLLAQEVNALSYHILCIRFSCLKIASLVFSQYFLLVMAGFPTSALFIVSKLWSLFCTEKCQGNWIYLCMVCLCVCVCENGWKWYVIHTVFSIVCTLAKPSFYAVDTFK
uniref:Uncharacterized protein n=1 Tax=Micrurus spixii TaxID=129469 RepID=A0A2D4M8A2_9SAUR